MGTEIERKYLLDEDFDPSTLCPREKISIRQGYINLEKERLVRVRLYNSKRAELTIKGKKTDLTRYEFEYDIPYQEGEELINKIAKTPIIKKIRYIVDYKEYEWEVDVFKKENRGLILAEIELEKEDEEFELPEFVTQEVTEDPRYYNYNLVMNPYNRWEKKEEKQ